MSDKSVLCVGLSDLWTTPWVLLAFRISSAFQAFRFVRTVTVIEVRTFYDAFFICLRVPVVVGLVAFDVQTFRTVFGF